MNELILERPLLERTRSFTLAFRVATGPKQANIQLGSHIMDIYKRISTTTTSSPSSSADNMSVIFSASFISQLCTRLHLKSFLDSYLPLVVTCMMVDGNHELTGVRACMRA